MVWGCMASSEAENLNIIGGIIDRYIDLSIFKENLRSSAEKEELADLYNIPHVIKRPHSHQTLIPTKIYGSYNSRTFFSNRNQLKWLSIQESQNIRLNATENLVNLMPRRLQAIIQGVRLMIAQRVNLQSI